MLIRVCRADEIPEGGAKLVRVLARRVAVFRLDGQLYAIEADCKHMKASLVGGRIEGTVITCPAHGWRYDITTGECLTEPWARLRQYETKVNGGVIYLNLPP